MRKFFSFLLFAAAVALTSHAVTVNNTAGQLSEKVTNHQLTQLTVIGTMDARDFLFITDKLNELTSIDLSQVTITAISQEKPLYSTVTIYRANEIPRTAFFGKKLTSVTLPANLESVGFAAFAGCDLLRSVTLPASVTRLDDYAFAGSGLTSVVVPETVASMGKGVFARCPNLTSATVQGAMLGDFCFLGDTKLSQVTLGPSVSYILKAVFSGCTSLTSINIDPACRINRIDEEAFINSGLASINLENLGLGTIGDWAFAQTQLSSMQLPNGMTQLGEGALAHNPLLTSVVLPGARKNGSTGHFAPSSPRHTIENIKDYTFAGDEALNAGELLREGVNTIGNYALYNVCQEMDTMRLPSTLSYLGDYAMAGMIGMQTLKTDAVQVPALGIDVWAGVDQPSVPLFAPTAESTEQYKAADQWMNFFFQNVQPAVKPGDVNGDDAISMDDLTALINFLLTGDPTGINLQGADVDGSTDISMDDLTALINMLLTSSSKKSGNFRVSLPARYGYTSDQFVLQSLTIAPGETRTLDIALDNVEHAYTAFQCMVELPQGLKLTGVKGVSRGEEHSFFVMQVDQEENVYSLIGASLNMLTFGGNEGNVMRFTITASEDFDAHKAAITLADAILVTKRNEVYVANDAYVMVNDNTGVENINADKQVADVRYINVAGQESDTPFNGVNIVVTTYTDGTTSTVKVVK